MFYSLPSANLERERRNARLESILELLEKPTCQPQLVGIYSGSTAVLVNLSFESFGADKLSKKCHF